MFGIIERSMDREKAVRSFYQTEARRPQIVELSSEGSADEGSDGPIDDSDSEASTLSEEDYEEVYITVPKRKSKSAPHVHHADRTVPSTRTARRQVFDGVYPPSRDRGKARGGDKGPEKAKADQMPIPNEVTSPAAEKPPPQVKSQPGNAGSLPEITPVEARKVRFKGPVDVEMEAVDKEKTKKKNSEKEAGEKEIPSTKTEEAVSIGPNPRYPN
ncbi:hypothetical protein FB451DRAFT_1193851 [Mycena latifolia]|nr:hypothetical protein FB451DRAFT_1193851 [Mycena latifolia]